MSRQQDAESLITCSALPLPPVPRTGVTGGFCQYVWDAESSATDTVNTMLKEIARKFTSLTLAGLKRIAKSLDGYQGHIIIDDLGVEKSTWSRTATITVLAHLCYSHYIHKISQQTEILIQNFYGSAAINIQPVLMESLVADLDWIALIRDKGLRYYHLIRPINAVKELPAVTLDWGESFRSVHEPKGRKQLWYQLVAIGLTQWSIARCKEHLEALLKACAALDNRLKVKATDYKLLIKLLQPMQLERYIVDSYAFESGRTFNNNLYCLLVELATYGEPSVEVISDDYKVSPSTVIRICKTEAQWVWLKSGTPTRVCAKEDSQKILDIAGVYQKW